MQPHVKNYMDSCGYCIEDVIMCEYCNSQVAVSVHHIVFRSQGGSDDPENLIGLCPDCDFKAHNEDIKSAEFFEIVEKRING